MACETLFLIRRFFCCCSLKIGSLIIGYLGLLGNVLQTAGGSAQLHYVKSITSSFTMKSIANSNSSASLDFSGLQGLYTEYMAIIIAYHVISVLFHLALVMGIHKTKSECILPWLVVKGFETVVAIVISIVATIYYMMAPGMEVGLLFLIIFIFCICCWLAVYSYMCVYSYYHEIKYTPEIETEEKDLPPIYIKSFIDEKKQNVAAITISQNNI